MTKRLPPIGDRDRLGQNPAYHHPVGWHRRYARPGWQPGLTALHWRGKAHRPNCYPNPGYNLFTGVLACGIICIFSCWVDRRCLAAPFKTLLLNAIAAVLFTALGIKAYWDHSG